MRIWDTTPFEEVFEHGFRARRQESTTNDIYFNLDHYVHHAGRPLDSRRPATHVFVSTTLNTGWFPSLDAQTPEMVVYRYEIYAPGGIWVAQTLGDRYRYPGQDEVAFVAGIAPQYIYTAQRFRLTFDANTRHTRRERVDTALIRNNNFNPLASGNIQMPVYYYLDGNRRRVRLSITYFPASQRKKREVSTFSDANVSSNEAYINAAFRSSSKNEVYLFMKNEYVLLNYAPGTTNDRVVNGPLLICDGYPSLTGTAFAEHGIDCAFGSYDKNEAFIFSGNLCARINYAPGTTNDWIIKGPMTIAKMFSFFKGTAFESGIDAAFESTAKYEAYLFKGDKYALINYSSNGSHLIAIRGISEGYPSLRGTIFESGIDAAFASHSYNEAYIFKGDSYAVINFAPGTTNDYIINGPKQILPNWPSLSGILPWENNGLDVHYHTTSPDADRDHDEL
ncbi:hypothetical protein ACLOJK_002822 [Asimina triloba]